MCDVCKAEGAIFDEVQRTVLENREGNHNKQYTVTIERVGEQFRVMARYGPIGKWVKSDEKSDPTSFADAKDIARKLVDKKVSSRGYSLRICR